MVTQIIAIHAILLEFPHILYVIGLATTLQIMILWMVRRLCLAMFSSLSGYIFLVKINNMSTDIPMSIYSND